jgi:hypothetical protein
MEGGARAFFAGALKLETRNSKLEMGGAGVVHRLWCLSLGGEARGVSQRLLPGMRGAAAGGAGADIRRGAHFLDSDPARWILETLGMHGVWPRSACKREDAARVQMGGIIYSGARRVHFLGGFRHAGHGGGILGWTDRGAGGCGAAAAAFAAHAEGTDFERKTRNDSACGRHGVPVLWCTIAGAGLAMFMPGVWSREELGAKAE